MIFDKLLILVVTKLKSVWPKDLKRSKILFFSPSLFRSTLNSFLFGNSSRWSWTNCSFRSSIRLSLNLFDLKRSKILFLSPFLFRSSLGFFEAMIIDKFFISVFNKVKLKSVWPKDLKRSKILFLSPFLFRSSLDNFLLGISRRRSLTNCSFRASLS